MIVFGGICYGYLLLWVNMVCRFVDGEGSLMVDLCMIC